MRKLGNERVLDQVLKLGNPLLYEVSAPVKQAELPALIPQVQTLHDIVEAFRAQHGFGRAIAAPQIGLMKRIICLNTDRRVTMINPVLSDMSEELMELWDDCMSFPGLLVRVRRHRRCVLTFLDENWTEQRWALEDDMSELIQHEYDHLDGILATQRAIDDRSFKIVAGL